MTSTEFPDAVKAVEPIFQQVYDFLQSLNDEIDSDRMEITLTVDKKSTEALCELISVLAARAASDSSLHSWPEKLIGYIRNEKTRPIIADFEANNEDCTWDEIAALMDSKFSISISEIMEMAKKF